MTYPTPAPTGAGQPGSAGDQSGGGHRRFRRRGPFSRLLHRGQPTGARAGVPTGARAGSATGAAAGGPTGAAAGSATGAAAGGPTGAAAGRRRSSSRGADGAAAGARERERRPGAPAGSGSRGGDGSSPGGSGSRGGDRSSSRGADGAATGAATGGDRGAGGGGAGRGAADAQGVRTTGVQVLASHRGPGHDRRLRRLRKPGGAAECRPARPGGCEAGRGQRDAPAVRVPPAASRVPLPAARDLLGLGPAGPGPAGHRRGQRAPRSRAGGPGVPRWLPPGRGTGTGFVLQQRPSRAGHQPDAPVPGIGTVTGGGARTVCGLGSGPGRRSRSAPERDGLVPGPARAPDARWLRTVRAAVRHARADVRVLHGFVDRAAHWVIRGLRAGRSTAWAGRSTALAVPRGRPGTGSQRAGRPGSGRQPAVPGPDRAGPARPHAGRDPAPGRGEAGEPRGRRRAAEAPLPDRPPGHPDAPQQREPAGAGGS